MVRHVVMFSFKKDAEDAEIKEVDALFKELPSVISEIQSFESGVNISPENLDKGFTHIYLLSFADEKARDIYLYHKTHQAFSAKAGKIFDDVMVMDYLV